MLALTLLAAAAISFSPQSFTDAVGPHTGAFVILPTGERPVRFNEAGCAEKLPPCSTFKIWNTLIGLDTGLISGPDAPFWKWDGQTRSIAAWNRDQTLRTAFAASCVPAYQALARKIDAAHMTAALHALGYGDENIAAGIDVFWLPAPDRKTILISPNEQAALIARLVAGNVPFSPRGFGILKDVMQVKQTPLGTLFGKTGTGKIGPGKVNLGWFVGYVESGAKVYPLACTLRGEGVMGADARTVAEKVFAAAGLF